MAVQAYITRLLLKKEQTKTHVCTTATQFSASVGLYVFDQLENNKF